jgi:hypothetical protein
MARQLLAERIGKSIPLCVQMSVMRDHSRGSTSDGLSESQPVEGAHVCPQRIGHLRITAVVLRARPREAIKEAVYPLGTPATGYHSLGGPECNHGERHWRSAHLIPDPMPWSTSYRCDLRRSTLLRRCQTNSKTREGSEDVDDINNNTGWVSIGTDHKTVFFAVNAIRRRCRTLTSAPPKPNVFFSADGVRSNWISCPAIEGQTLDPTSTPTVEGGSEAG